MESPGTLLFQFKQLYMKLNLFCDINFEFDKNCKIHGEKRGTRWLYRDQSMLQLLRITACYNIYGTTWYSLNLINFSANFVVFLHKLQTSNFIVK